MKVRDFFLKKRVETKGPRDFYITAGTYDNFLKPLSEEFNKYNVEMNEIIFFSILLSAKNRKNSSSNSELHDHSRKNGSEGSPKGIFNISELDQDKMNFLLSVMVYLYGYESIFDYKDMIKKLEDLAEEGLKILHDKYAKQYMMSPSKFADNIFKGEL
ncbi:MAG: hypothetical protein M1481_03345 [Candidatus Thermoplasmatota archaeon]|nr:hypothetical protein [Candidatus Thermoplasmatota archaeon]MCL5963783.1 hypothetical protein [Candidatus Thermoplasmatota archaeon]